MALTSAGLRLHKYAYFIDSQEFENTTTRFWLHYLAISKYLYAGDSKFEFNGQIFPFVHFNVEGRKLVRFIYSEDTDENAQKFRSFMGDYKYQFLEGILRWQDATHNTVAFTVWKKGLPVR